MNIDTSGWKGFVINGLFDRAESRKKKDFNKNLDVSTERSEEFDLPLVNAKHGNNGIMYYGRSAEMDSFTNVLCIVQNGAVATGDVYVHTERVGILEDAYLIIPRFEADRYILMFLACVMQKVTKQHFCYDNKATWDKVKALSIPLPADEGGNPDREYMRTHMKATEEAMAEKLDALSGILS